MNTEKRQPDSPEIPAKYNFVWTMLENLDNDYITFLLGFVSSIVITEFYELFNYQVSKSVVCFIIMTCNVLVLTVSTLMLLHFTISFANTKKTLEPYCTSVARLNYALANWARFSIKLKKLKIELYWMVALIAIDLAINVFKFFWINFFETVTG